MELGKKFDRDWDFERYTELMKGEFGYGVSTDADERPTLFGCWKIYN